MMMLLAHARSMRPGAPGCFHQLAHGSLNGAATVVRPLLAR